jgi:Na+-translocating ferredoxin:NAD+ oxidoreductase RnfD subunit
MFLLKAISFSLRKICSNLQMKLYIFTKFITTTELKVDWFAGGIMLIINKTKCVTIPTFIRKSYCCSLIFYTENQIKEIHDIIKLDDGDEIFSTTSL